MDLVQMSVSASILIVAIVMIRALTLQKLPKKTFLVLWGVTVFRLLVPVSIPSPFSFYTGIDLFAQRTGGLSPAGAASVPDPADLPGLGGSTGAAAASVSPSEIVWLAGMCACMLFFAAAYLKCRRAFGMSLPVENEITARWLREHPLRRPVQLRQSGRIKGPLTYGVFRPVILFPKKTDWTDETKLQYILAHESVHIRHFDALTKLMLTAAVCVHWFNPFVWMMYLLANRDIELSCDEAVVRIFGETAKSDYALTLIGLEEKKGRLAPFVSNFSKNAMEERIVSIMKMKKTSLAGMMLALALVVVTVAIFATNGAYAKDSKTDAELVGGTVVNSANPKDEILAAGPLEVRQTVPVKAESLASGEFIRVGEKYTFGEDDFIAFELRAESAGNLNVEFRKADDPTDQEPYLSQTGYCGNSIDTLEVPQAVKTPVGNLAGTYYLWIGNYEGETLKNIHGTVQIFTKVNQ